MKFVVTYGCVSGEHAHYDIELARKKWRVSREVLADQLRGLKPRIEAMARRELGKRFARLVLRESGELPHFVLMVKKGTANAVGARNAQGYELRAFLGWVELFASERV